MIIFCILWWSTDLCVHLEAHTSVLFCSSCSQPGVMAQTDMRGDNLTRSHTQIRQMRLFLPHPPYAAGQIRLDGNPTINPTEVLHHLSPNTLIQAPAKPVTTHKHTHTHRHTHTQTQTQRHATFFLSLVLSSGRGHQHTKLFRVICLLDLHTPAAESLIVIAFTHPSL